MLDEERNISWEYKNDYTFTAIIIILLGMDNLLKSILLSQKNS